MKKVQNYLTKPEQLKKKLEDPSFKHDFLQWSKSQICSAQPRHSRSKSPHQNSKKQLHSLHNKSLNTRSKENITPNALAKSSSLSKKNINVNKSYSLDTKQQKEDNSIIKRRAQSKSQSHFQSLNHLAHNRSLEDGNDSKIRSSYSSLKKNREDSIIKNKSLKKKKIEESSIFKKSPPTEKKLQFHYSYRTRQGVLASNPNKTNQDRLYVKTKIPGQFEKNLFAVADGHGTFGHCVSQMIASSFGSLIEK